MANAAGIFKAVAPWLFAGASTLLPGPLGQAAAKIGAIVGKPDLKPDLQTISEAVAGATPEQLAQIRAADQQHELDMQKAGFQHVEDLINAEYSDTANARSREIQAKDSWTPRLLAAFIVIGWMLIQWYLLMHTIPDKMMPVVMRALGTFDAALTICLGYYFGSSKGSDDKNEIISNLSK